MATAGRPKAGMYDDGVAPTSSTARIVPTLPGAAMSTTGLLLSYGHSPYTHIFPCDIRYRYTQCSKPIMCVSSTLNERSKYLPDGLDEKP